VIAEGDRSRADLVRLLRTGKPGLFDRCAGMLGFEPRPDYQAEPPSISPGTYVSEKVVEQSASKPTLDPSKAAYLRTIAASHVDAEDTTRVKVVPLPEGKAGAGKAPRVPTPDALVPWPRLWRRLRPHLCQWLPTHDVDVQALVELLARAQNVTRVPRLRRARLASHPQIVLDRTPRQMPFWVDQDRAAAHLGNWLSRSSGEPFPVFPGQSPQHCLQHGYADHAAPDLRGRVVLLLGDLGAYGGEGARLAWQEAGAWLRKQGATLRALVPAPWWRVDPGLAELWNAIPWDEREGRAVPLDACECRQRVERLLTLLAPALRIEPGLLRRVRLRFCPGSTDSSTEVDLLDHPAVVSFSAEALSLDPQWKQQLEQGFAKLDRGLQHELRQLLHAWHEELRPEISAEERFLLFLRLPTLFDNKEKNELQAFVLQAAAAIDTQDAQGSLASDVAAWFRDFKTRLPETMWTDATLGRALRRAWAVAFRKQSNAEPPPGFTAEDMQVRSRGSNLAPTRWHLYQVGQGLHARTAVAFSDGGPQVRMFVKNTVMGSPVAEIVAASPEILVDVPGAGSARYSLDKPIPLPESCEAIVLTTDRQELRLEAFERPTWAKRAGRDAFGLWAEIEYKGMAQRMRWIAPGRFWMGSPEDEPERGDNEVLHQVELTEGYWLADTACTQDLWVAVMGENPSTFKEREKGKESRPVENVSWEDCQRFLQQLNAAIPGLELRLPTEAEWENACRAGTTTPFSFGTNVTNKEVNYYGEFPYAGAAKSEPIGKTVPVKSLPGNQWGLNEMHGNVFEWCLDWYAPYKTGLAVDPVGVDDSVGLRVFRGGSWFNLARWPRSAFRDGNQPGWRFSLLGFRFARGRPVQQDKPAGAEGARGPRGRGAMTRAEPDGFAGSEASREGLGTLSGFPSQCQPERGPRATEAATKPKAAKKKGIVDRLFGKKGTKK
jgi:formylglycine-generating enzyme required for sulfatase activity